MSQTIKSQQSNEFPPSVHAYCRSAAVCFSHVTDRSDRPTVTVEFAHRRDVGGYDWLHKAAFQLGQSELAEFCAYLRQPWSKHKWVHGCRGPAMKGLELRQQSPNILFDFTTVGDRILIPIIPRDQYFIFNLAFSRLIEIQPKLPLQAHYDTLDRLSVALSRSG